MHSPLYDGARDSMRGLQGFGCCLKLDVHVRKYFYSFKRDDILTCVMYRVLLHLEQGTTRFHTKLPIRYSRFTSKAAAASILHADQTHE